MKAGIVVFPGSNCDHDLYQACQRYGFDVRYLWHKERIPPNVDVVMLPGGFSYGDYLRPGAIARLSPVMAAVRAHAARGGKVIGICNGFQILCETGLLPGALLRNEGQKFICRDVFLKVNPDSWFTAGAPPVVRIPIAHADGRYYADASTLQEMEERGQILFRYCDASGAVTAENNPNGSVHNIAGICNAAGNVIGMMPHPERAADERLGKTDGHFLFESMLHG